MTEIKLGDSVDFLQGNEAGTVLDGVITRVWPNGKYVTIKTDEGHTYCRLIQAVRRIGFHVNYYDAICRTDLYRSFDSREAAQYFIDCNAMVYPLPHCSITTYPR